MSLKDTHTHTHTSTSHTHTSTSHAHLDVMLKNKESVMETAGINKEHNVQHPYKNRTHAT